MCFLSNMQFFPAFVLEIGVIFVGFRLRLKNPPKKGDPGVLTRETCEKNHFRRAGPMNALMSKEANKERDTPWKINMEPENHLLY